MKTIRIGNKNYTFEYSIEASLYNNCTAKVTELVANAAMAESRSDLKELISTMSNVPQVVLAMFHAGLQEHHGVFGDNTMSSEDNTKNLLRQYLMEHKGEDSGSFYGLMEVLMEVMADDGFFELIGVNKMFAPKKTAKTPQDHQKKETKATEK